MLLAKALASRWRRRAEALVRFFCLSFCLDPEDLARILAEDERKGFRREARGLDSGAAAGLGKQREVAAEHDVTGSHDLSRQRVDLRRIEQAGTCSVKTGALQGDPHFRHEGVEGQSTAPMG